ncbi:MAG: hypothetical protein ACOC2C_05890, partial [Cyclonatronaceae bacterium]
MQEARCVALRASQKKTPAEITEGGKPNLFFYIQLNLTKNEVKKTLSNIEGENRKKESVLDRIKRYGMLNRFEDKLMYIHKSDLKVDFRYRLIFKHKKIELSHPFILCLAYIDN